jgi:2-oxoglutarate dehydrogenase E2 component (dihydrolipoamide succinyltransferase)
MAQVELIMPKMGESIMEATILNWLKQVGDEVDVDENILEIATDKVDSEIPSPVKGVISEILFKVNDVVEVGTVIARIATEGESPEASPAIASTTSANGSSETTAPASPPKPMESQPASYTTQTVQVEREARPSVSNRFYSPLVRNIAQAEGMSIQELDAIAGSGLNGRVTKHDIMNYVANRGASPKVSSQPPKVAPTEPAIPQTPSKQSASSSTPKMEPVSISAGQGEEIIEMGRMRKLIADHMVHSVHTSPHVTSYVEADVTNLFNWRAKHKDEFQKKHGEKITFTPIFMEAVVKAILDFPMVNVSVSGDQIIKKNYIHIGMAAALPSGNLIVPVIKHADQLNLVGLTRQVNDLANRARANQLKPDEIQGGTFTLTNVGTFGNVMGTPIINQPQVAILAVGAIRKKPAVIETEYGDVIAIRQQMFLSLSYDHRIVDGALGGSFLRRIADYLEKFDSTRQV